MNEDSLIRVENLRRLGKTPAELAQLVGGRYTYWHDMLAGTKSFGEKAARKIEAATGLPRGWLDHPQNPITPREVLVATTGDQSARRSKNAGSIAAELASIDNVKDLDQVANKIKVELKTARARIRQAAALGKKKT